MNKPNSLQSLRAVLYTRVSTTGQAESGTSLAAQFAACLQKAEQVGAAVIAHFEDAGVSGATYEERDGLQKAIAAIEEGRANLLICYDLSRYSRDSEHQLLIKRRIENAGGKLVFCTLSFEDNADGDLLFDITRAFPVWERRKIRERTMRGKRDQAKEGIQTARGFKGYGYRIVTKEDVLTGRYPAGTVGTYQTVPEEAKRVLEIFERAARGDSTRSIARYLYSQEVPTAQGNRNWSGTTVYSILRNPVHKGEPVYGKMERVVDETRRKQGFRPHYYRPTSPDQQIRLSSPIIVDPEIWELVQERLEENKARKSGNPKRKHVFSGLLRCPHCGGSIVGKTNKGKVYYSCGRATKGKEPGRESCIAKYHNAETVTSLFLSAFRAIFETPEKLAAAIEAERFRTTAQSVSPNNTGKLRDELIALDAEERATVEAQIQGIKAGANPAIYGGLFEKIAARRTALQTELNLVKTLSPTTPERTPKETARFVAEKVKRLPEIFTSEKLTAVEKHDYAAQFIKSMIPTEEGLTINLRPEVMGETVHNIRLWRKARGASNCVSVRSLARRNRARLLW